MADWSVQLENPNQIWMSEGWACSAPFLIHSGGDILKLLRSLGIYSKESIPPGYVAQRAGTTTLFLLGS